MLKFATCLVVAAFIFSHTEAASLNVTDTTIETNTTTTTTDKPAKVFGFVGFGPPAKVNKPVEDENNQNSTFSGFQAFGRPVLSSGATVRKILIHSAILLVVIYWSMPKHQPKH